MHGALLATNELTAYRAARRMAELMELGGVQTRLWTRKQIPVVVGPVSCLVFYLPDVDPVTRRATGLVKVARRV